MADHQKPGILANVLAVAGFVILILIIVWGAYNLLTLTGVGVSSLFSRFSGNAISVVAPETAVESGKAFPLSWQYAPEEEGTYALLYQCNDDFNFSVQAEGGPVAEVPCGNTYGVGSLNSLSLTPKFSGTENIDVPLSVIFMPAATSSDARAEGNVTITVAPANVPIVTTPKAPTQPTTPSINVPAAKAGAADLSVHIVAIGVIDPASGVFVQRTPGPNDTAAVQFDIKNSGAAASGSYRFSVQLPTQPVYPYISALQNSLAPGAHVVSTLRFGPVAPGGGTIAIEVDAARSVKESARANNTTAIWMNASTYPSYYNVPFVY